MTDVARLEALLARVRENRAKPRPTRAVAAQAASMERMDTAPKLSDFNEIPVFESTHETIHGIPAPSVPPPSPPVALETVVAPLVAFEPAPFAAEPEPLAADAFAAESFAQEPEPFAVAPEPLAVAEEPVASEAFSAEADAAEPVEAAQREPEAPLLSVLPAAFDDDEEFEEPPVSAGFDDFDEHGDSMPPAAFVSPAGSQPAAVLVPVAVTASAISPPSEPIARVAAPLPEPLAATFGGLLRRTLALRPR